MAPQKRETIVAQSSPRGFGAISIVRLSGKQSLPILKKIFTPANAITPRKATYGRIVDNGSYIDKGIVTYYRAPASYTGEDIAEINLHGNPYICERVIDICIRHGARPAKPGEFTKRAFLNGKMDLSQAEGVADLIYSSSEMALRASHNLLDGKIGQKFQDIKKQLIDLISILELELDFAEEEIDFMPHKTIAQKIMTIREDILSLSDSYEFGRIIREGFFCPIIGPPNSGKSSLFNAFLQEERVIVSHLPGTTRDAIEESFRYKDHHFRIVDTAGLRRTKSQIEKDGIKRTKSIINRADYALYVIDVTAQNGPIQQHVPRDTQKLIYVLNKIDVASHHQIEAARKRLPPQSIQVTASAKEHWGLDEILDTVIKVFNTTHATDETAFITRKRHQQALKSSANSLNRSLASISRQHPSEIIVIDLRQALDFIDEVLGRTTNEDIINNIFKNFCIGK